MTGDDLKDMAREALKEMREAALYDGATHVRPGGAEWVESLYARLLGLVDKGPSANPSYTCMGETAAATIILATTVPEAYARLFSGISLGTGFENSGFPMNSRLADLALMDYFLHSLADDHDFGVDPHGDFPVVRMAEDIDPWVGGINPRSFLDVIRPMVDPGPWMSGP